MTDDLTIAVQQCVDQGVPARSVPFDWKNQRYWIKIGLKSQENNWHKVQNFFAAILFNPVLRATVSLPLDEGLQGEARRLKRVAQRDVLVPVVVAQQPGWLLLSDIGPCLQSQLQTTEDKAGLILNAAQALSDLHQAGGWHGTGQLRDMIVGTDGRIGFIDFEECVGEAMDAPAAQARDIMRFLISAVRFDGGDGKLLTDILSIYRQNAPKEVWPHVASTLGLMKPLAFMLKPFEKKLGRDLRHALLVYNALKSQI